MAKTTDGFDMWAWLENEMAAPAFEHAKSLMADTGALVKHLGEQLPTASMGLVYKALGIEL